jgi:uncharacterized membrane protein YdjX (TVP38/TMEM64 family)
MTQKTKWTLVAFAVLIALGAVVFLTEGVDWHGLRQSLEAMDRGPLLALVAVLPVFGFSIALVYLVVGAVFGGWVGLAVVAGVTAVHLLGSHWIARSFLRGPVERFLKRRKHRMPELPEGSCRACLILSAITCWRSRGFRCGRTFGSVGRFMFSVRAWFFFWEILAVTSVCDAWCCSDQYWW